ncbi:MAG: TIGR03086 family metal-binding protein [Actinomycetota bacterium]|nr:TIGR03086 family metal-binding protein [Actinomycetota bacterium]
MPTILATLLDAHRTAILASIGVVDQVRTEHLNLPTPCGDWPLAELLAHMTAQHLGFASAARGSTDARVWDPTTVLDSVTTDPGGSYAAAAHDVLAAFAADGVAEVQFRLPDLGPDVTVPGDMALGFHFVDYVVHGWDVAVTIGAAYRPPADVLTAVLPIALAVPDGDFREQPGAPFARAVEPAGADDFERILTHLGRRPGRTQA